MTRQPIELNLIHTPGSISCSRSQEGPELLQDPLNPLAFGCIALAFGASLST